MATSCKQETFSPEWIREQAPSTYLVRFETTKGDFEIQVTRSHSPHAADRFYQLVTHGYFDNGFFYRVVPEFVAQFGNTDTIAMNQWRRYKIPDEPVIQQNLRGTISFARTGPETRDVEVFINLANNHVLDTIGFEGVRGFPSFGKVVKGMEVVDKLYSGYGETTMGDPNLYQNRDRFYADYPKLDLIREAYIIDP